MKELRLKYNIRDLCNILSVSRSGYYEYIKRRLSKRQQEEGMLEVAIKAARRVGAVMGRQSFRGT